MRILTQKEKGAEMDEYNELVFLIKNKLWTQRRKARSINASFVNYAAGKWNKVVKLYTQSHLTREPV